MEYLETGTDLQKELTIQASFGLILPHGRETRSEI